MVLGLKGEQPFLSRRISYTWEKVDILSRGKTMSKNMRWHCIFKSDIIYVTIVIQGTKIKQ